MPDGGAADRARVGIEHDLGRVEPLAALGIPRPVHAIAVELSGPEPGHVAVEHVPGPRGERHACALARVSGRVEETQLDARRALGDDREVHARSVPRRAERLGPPW